MPSPEVDRFLDILATKSPVKADGSGWSAKCPCRDDDHNPSLHVGEGRDGRVLVTCHRGGDACDLGEICSAMNLELSDLFPPGSDLPNVAVRAPKPKPKPPKPKTTGATPTPFTKQDLQLVCVYPYVDTDGTPIFEKVRYIDKATGKKTFRQRRKDPLNPSKWLFNLDGIPKVLYRLDQVTHAVDNHIPVWVCYSPDTEVLTPTGWVPFPEAQGNLVAQWSQDGSIQFVEPSAWQVFDYTGEMVHISADWCDLLVTPDHRQPAHYERCQHAVVQAANLKRHHILPVAGTATGTTPVTEAEARLLAAWLADGINETRGFQTSWNLKKARKLERLHALLDAVGIPYRDHRYDSCPEWTSVRVQRSLIRLDLCDGKRYRWDMLDWANETRVAFIEELGHWDGDFSGVNGIRFFTGDREAADIVTAMAALTGYGAILRVDSRDGRADSYVVNIIRKAERTLGATPKRLNYDGKVHCCTVPSGFLVVRRNGKVTISGNCEGEKDADRLYEIGETGTTMPGGAGKWLPEHTDTLAGATVYVVGDNDPVGIAHAIHVIGALTRAGCNVIAMLPPEPHKDLSDALDAGVSIYDFVDWNPSLADLDNEPSDTTGAPDSGEHPDGDTWAPSDADIDTYGPPAGDPDNDDPGADDPFGLAVTQLGSLLANTKLTGAQKFTRAHAVLDQLGADNDYAPGRLVDWYDFLNEADGDYDWVIPGVLERGDRVMWVASEGLGKALDLNTPIPTTTGWTTMGQINVADTLFDRHGTPCTVTALSPILDQPESYRVRFSDGTHLDACADHQWYTENISEREQRRPGSVRTTAEIRDTLISSRASKAKNHAIPVAGALQLPDVDLPIPPYTLGVWLGDGTSRTGGVTLNRLDADDIIARIESEGFTVSFQESGEHPGSRTATILGLKVRLDALGLIQNKHIPEIYLRGSETQRRALFAGLMDTDGYAPDTDGVGRGSGACTCEYSSTSAKLAHGVTELARTLGVNAKNAEGVATLNGKVIGPKYRITFQSPTNPFYVERKAARWYPLRSNRSQNRYIVAVDPIDSVPMRCIAVDSADHTFLAGHDLIPTHNSVLTRQVAIALAVGLHPFTRVVIPKKRTLVIDLENPDRIVRRVTRNTMRVARAMVRDPDPHYAKLLLKPSGLNLLKTADRAYLESVLEEHTPDFVGIGPLYKAFIDPGGRTSEAVAIEVATYLDRIREHYGCALWMEHHAPLGNSLTGRDLRPFGSAVWSRWPEFGMTISRDELSGQDHVYDVGTFRGSRDERAWPTRMKRGSIDDLPFHILDYSGGGRI